jgi:hypothetical protein
MNNLVKSHVTVQDVKVRFVHKEAFLTVQIRGKCFKKSMIEMADSSFFQERRWLELD